MQYEDLLQNAIRIAKEAGDAILDIYHTEYEVSDKDDDSPLTEADMASHRLIEKELSRLTADIPVVSEESDDLDKRRSHNTVWVVDPLDGTKEFIQKNGEFTVNIALVENQKPVLGVVHAPALQTTYSGADGIGATSQQGEESTPITADNNSDQELVTVVASRSHQDEYMQHFLDQFPSVETTSIGSSLKLCLVADGSAMLYPRLAPTMEWDTAAGDAIVRAAGGNVSQLDGTPLEYNKPDLYNPYFIATSSDAPAWQSKLPDSLQ